MTRQTPLLKIQLPLKTQVGITALKTFFQTQTSIIGGGGRRGEEGRKHQRRHNFFFFNQTDVLRIYEQRACGSRMAESVHKTQDYRSKAFLSPKAFKLALKFFLQPAFSYSKVLPPGRRCTCGERRYPLSLTNLFISGMNTKNEHESVFPGHPNPKPEWFTPQRPNCVQNTSRIDYITHKQNLCKTPPGLIKLYINTIRTELTASVQIV